MFNDDWHADHLGLGVKMNLATAFLVGLGLAARSKVGCAIGGPDSNLVVFLAGFVEIIRAEIAKHLDWKLITQLNPTVALAAATTTRNFAQGHINLVSSAILGFLLFLTGRFKFTRFATYIPTSVPESFMSCVG